MKVFVTGGTGFVGSEVLRQLTAAGYTVRALVRPGSEGKLAVRDGVEIRHGDATEAATLAGTLTGCDAVIHLVGIIREFPAKGITFERLHVEATRHVLAAAQAQGVKRYLHMSANGTGPAGSTAYHRTKWAAEQAVRASDRDWTIFRPSLIFGKGGEFVTMLADLIRKAPIVPVFGDGRYRMQPVAVEQVAESFVRALALPETAGQTYHLGGAASYSYDEILDLTGTAIGCSHVAKAHQPLFMVKPLIRLMEHSAHFPLTSDQLEMLLQGNVCDTTAWAEMFGITPVSYAEGIGSCFD
ncbi:MAG: complex I NDUFA9 subunit family protein [Deltaproteobacteria bacterium]|nr:MAG: complex I NDUFA9 subunit family protein [Deltaproteobacteria bacterium]